MTSSFTDLGVPADLAAVLQRQGITAPFDIQTATIPDALAGRDVLGRAPTGSGKTLAFGIPLVASLGNAKPRRPKGLILSPTRELAEQIRRELEPLARERGRTLLAIYGGVGFRDQLRGLRDGADLVVACPGRLQDLLNQGEISLNEVNSVVVDEADRMADMGFLPAVRQLLDLTSPDRQTVMFSATLGKEVQVLTRNYQVDPVTHEVGEIEPDLSLVDHRFIRTEQRIKVPLAAEVINAAGPTVVFCRTRHGVDRVARQLKNQGVKAGWIHGGRSQNQRDSALHSFTNGRVKALIATDVAARGIHVDGVACVIHFDPPEDDKAYVHRSGRTARAGAAGAVVSFINSDQLKDTKKLQKQLGLPQEIEDAPSDLEPLAAPSQRSQPQRSQPQRSQPQAGQTRGGQSRPGQSQAGQTREGQPQRGMSGAPSLNSSDSRRDQPGRKSTRSSEDGRPGNESRNESRNDSAPDRQRQSKSDAPARREGGESGGQETFNDWTPPKKKSRSGPKRTAGKASAGQAGKRTGQPRPKKKRGGAPPTSSSNHRKGSSGPGSSARSGSGGARGSKGSQSSGGNNRSR